MRKYSFFYTVGRVVKGLTVTASDRDEATRRGLLMAQRQGDTPTDYRLQLKRA